ncbi:hypothetical protein BGZ61DRAFT_202381 [Ilyonectria robusta]|uniref:uncharacterized protein n=1 Tax=Ilyonectria robusta TaxID=1079257 RepID=UPI001E8D82A2|nr:uncharacterized protein BGZ61DRAFT_202381 [Ilyonectria robusta]KAH8722285.1 hypothetical protein BGZ61DRAFT_202381 [Ilyonectria robusta]
MPRSGMMSGIGFNLTLCPLFSPAAKTTLDGVDSNFWGRGKELRGERQQQEQETTTRPMCKADEWLACFVCGRRERREGSKEEL